MNDSWGIRFDKNMSQQNEKKLFFIVAFKWPTSWQSADRMSELWEDRPAYIFSSTARFAEQLHFHIFSSEDLMQASQCLRHNLWDGLVMLRWDVRFDCISSW